MIQDVRALEHQFVPQDLTHPDGQIDGLASALDPITHGGVGENTLIDRPSGSGKTTLAKYVARQLDQERLDFRWGYVSCQSDPTPTALHSISVAQPLLTTHHNKTGGSGQANWRCFVRY
jgi:Cdc6-like AAA superfamily ATPase